MHQMGTDGAVEHVLPLLLLLVLPLPEVAPRRARAGDYKCDGCPDAKALPDNRGFECKAIERVTLDARNALHTTDPAMQVALCEGFRVYSFRV